MVVVVEVMVMAVDQVIQDIDQDMVIDQDIQDMAAMEVMEVTVDIEEEHHMDGDQDVDTSVVNGGIG